MKSDIGRFMEKVDKTLGCWNWTGAQNGHGYGQFWFDGHSIPAHWFLLPRFPDTAHKEEACHHCDNRLCVRPSHIFIGTRTDNMRDCSTKGRLRFEPGLSAAVGKRLIWHNGESNHAHQLTEDQALLAKACPNKRGAASRLAESFGVSLTVICDIRAGKRWTHLPEPSATARQRCEAFLRTLGKWVEEDKA